MQEIHQQIGIAPRNWISAVLVSASLVFSFWPGANTRAADDATVVGSVFKNETRIFTGPCLFQPPTTEKEDSENKTQSLNLLPIIAAPLIETGLDFVVNSLAAAGQQQSAQTIAAFPATPSFYILQKSGQLQVNPHTACVQLVAGSFIDGVPQTDGKPEILPGAEVNEEFIVPFHTRDSSGQSHAYQNGTNGQDSSQDTANVYWNDWPVAKRFAKAGESLTSRFRQLSEPRLFFEARIEQVKNVPTLFRIRPNVLFFAKPADSSWAEWGTPARNLAINLSFIRGVDPATSAFATVSFPIRNVPGGTFVSPTYFLGIASEWLKAPALDDTEKQTIEDKVSALKQAKADMETVLHADDPISEPTVDQQPWRDGNYPTIVKAYCDYVGKQVKLRPEDLAKAQAQCPYDKELLRLDYEATKRLAIIQHSVALDKAKKHYAELTDGKDDLVTCTEADNEENCALNKPVDALQFTLTASAIEVKDASQFLTFLGKVASKAQPAAVTALENKYSPSARSNLAETHAGDYEAYEIAVGKVAVTQDVLARADAAGLADATQALLSAKIAANAAARKANQAEPYPDVSASGH